MGFSGDSGSGNISTSGDVALNSPPTNNVLTYDGAVSKWRNTPAQIGYNPWTVAAISLSDHTSLLQAVIDKCQTDNVKHLTIPQLNPNNSASPWILSDQLVLFAGLNIHAESATIRQKVTTRPAFYVPPNVDDVSIQIGLCYLDIGTGSRPTYSQLGSGTINGANAPGACSGIMSYGSNGRFYGEFSGFRNAVRLGNWSGSSNEPPYSSTDLRKDNRVDITVEDVDFGLVYFGQDGLDWTVSGSYLGMVGTSDPPHLVYATSSPVSRNVSGRGKARGGRDGVAFSFKTYDGLVLDYLYAYDCPGVLVIVDPLGPLHVGIIEGVELTTAVTVGESTTVEAVRGTITGDVVGAGGVKHIGSMSVSYADSVAAADIRVASFDDDWTVGSMTIDTVINDLDTSGHNQTLVQIYGDRFHAGLIKLNNTGTGGVRGIRFADTTSKHALTSPPSMRGVTDGVTIDSGVTDSVIYVDEALIHERSGFDELVNGAGSSVKVRLTT